MNTRNLIELLEDRIAPAIATVINPYMATYTDENGDVAVVKFSKPLLNAGSVGTTSSSLLQFSAQGSGEFLEAINLTGNGAAQGTNITVKSLASTGARTAGVGAINAAAFPYPSQVIGAINLGAVYVQGNLGQITGGEPAFYFGGPLAITSLTVGSMTQDLQSNVLGTIGTMTVQNDFNASLSVIGYQLGSIGTLTIGGVLAGDSAGDPGSGLIQFTGHIGLATIGSITGGTGAGTNVNTGELLGNGATDSSYISSLHVLGSITGGNAIESGFVSVQTTIGKLRVDGSIVGGNAGTPGNASTNTAAVPGDAGGVSAFSIRTGYIGGSIQGGTASPASDACGAILADQIGSLLVAGSIVGGSGPNSGIVTGTSGFVPQTYASIVVKGNITGGSGTGSGSIDATGFGVSSGFHFLNSSITALQVAGNIVGGSGGTSGVVSCGGNVKTLLVGGKVVGGNVTGGTSTAVTVNSLSDSGEINVGGTLGYGRVGGVQGGTMSGLVTAPSSTVTSATLQNAGIIEAGSITKLDVKGDVTAGLNSSYYLDSGGNDASTGQIFDSGSIFTSADIKTLIIEGSVISQSFTSTPTTQAGPTFTVTNGVYIFAGHGPAKAHATSDVAIGSVTIDGDATGLNLLAGFSTAVVAPSGSASDGSAQIGSVLIKGNMSASNIAAGVNPDANGVFGNASNTAATASTNGIYSTISSIIVQGNLTGSTSGVTGIVAEEVLNVQAANIAPLRLHAGPSNDEPPILIPGTIPSGAGAAGVYVYEPPLPS